MSQADDELEEFLKKIKKDNEQRKQQELNQQQNNQEEKKHQQDLNIYQDPQKNKQEINYKQTNNQLQIVSDQSNGNKFKFLLNRFFGLLKSINWRMVVNGILVLFGILIVIEIIMNLGAILTFLWECFIAIVVIGILFSFFN